MTSPTIAARLTAAELARLGNVLFGRHWTSELAAELGVSDRHVRRLGSGDQAITPMIRDALQTIAERRRKQIETTIEEIFP